ncbi:MAG TPA: hypothetical protein VFS83_10030 [Ktedonobacterales bacterium]|nr:hypothetical protein [Ktedonobacterales bacterium]
MRLALLLTRVTPSQYSRPRQGAATTRAKGTPLIRLRWLAHVRSMG